MSCSYLRDRLAIIFKMQINISSVLECRGFMHHHMHHHMHVMSSTRWLEVPLDVTIRYLATLPGTLVFFSLDVILVIWIGCRWHLIGKPGVGDGNVFSTSRHSLPFFLSIDLDGYQVQRY